MVLGAYLPPQLKQCTSESVNCNRSRKNISNYYQVISMVRVIEVGLEVSALVDESLHTSRVHDIMKSTKVQTLGIPTRMCDISTDDVLCRRLHIN